MFIKEIKSYLVVLCGAALSEFSIAQPEFNTWTGVNVRYLEKNDFRFGIETQLRLKKNATRFDLWYLTPEIQYKAKNDFKYGLAYRLSTEDFPVATSGLSHRFLLETETANLIRFINADSRWGQSFRFRGTSEWAGALPDYNLRLRAKTTYNLPGTKIIPSIAGEIFYHFDDQISYAFNSVESVHRFNKYRITAGLDLPLNKVHSFGINLIWQGKMENSNSDFIVECNYQLDLTRKKKKE